MNELNPHHLWPVVICGPKTPDDLYHYAGGTAIVTGRGAPEKRILVCELLAQGVRLYENTRVRLGHPGFGSECFDATGAPVNPQVGYLISPYWHEGANELRGYFLATHGFYRNSLEAREAAGGLADLALSQIIEGGWMTTPDGADILIDLRKVESVDIVPRANARTSGRFLLPRHYQECLAVAQGRLDDAKRIREALRVEKVHTAQFGARRERLTFGVAIRPIARAQS